jgi:hypothetical protein
MRRIAPIAGSEHATAVTPCIRLRRQIEAVFPHHGIVLNADSGEVTGRTQLGDDRALIADHKIAQIDLTLDTIVEAYPQPVVQRRARGNCPIQERAPIRAAQCGQTYPA